MLYSYFPWYKKISTLLIQHEISGISLSKLLCFPGFITLLFVCYWKFVKCIWRITEAVCYSLLLGIWILWNMDTGTAELLNVEYSALWLDVQIFCLIGCSLLRKTVSWGKLEWVLQLEWNIPTVPGEKGDLFFHNRWGLCSWYFLHPWTARYFWADLELYHWIVRGCHEEGWLRRMFLLWHRQSHCGAETPTRILGINHLELQSCSIK